MNISLSVSYNEQRLRRVIKFLVRRQFKWIRIIGLLALVGGVAGLVTGYFSSATATALLFLGVVLGLVMEPYSVAQSMRMQARVAQEGYVLTLDDTDFAVNAHSYSWRYSWSMLDRVVDTPGAWYLMFNKIQAQAVFKDLMGEEERAEFADFLARRESARPA
ncbi:YcxB family protein [Saccharothrix syringae]|uniref:YcxB family protein n=1 Tax=Saccharothrix syringae TaxID=103733 RepID=A0A5Q0H259_SACSY|nr:YcxB family protein [Saccharothrix syringae]QFZ19910.1 YcxB family protein [Saccharothrix syringae]